MTTFLSPELSVGLAKAFYVAILFLLLLCLWKGHRTKKINLWDCVTHTAANGATYTDPKRLAYIGAFAVMTVALAYFALVDQLTDWFCGIYVSAFVLGKWLGDREQRLSKGEKPT